MKLNGGQINSIKRRLLKLMDAKKANEVIASLKDGEDTKTPKMPRAVMKRIAYGVVNGPMVATYRKTWKIFTFEGYVSAKKHSSKASKSRWEQQKERGIKTAALVSGIKPYTKLAVVA